MNDQYPIGTVCEYINLTGIYAHQNGMKCEIVDSIKNRLDRNQYGILDQKPTYLVRDAEGEFSVLPRNLRKPKEPPKQSDSQWADEAIRKLKKQSSDHVVVHLDQLIPEESTQ